MLDYFSVNKLYFQLVSDQDFEYRASILVSETECRCNMFRDGKPIQSEVPNIVLPLPADDESKEIVTDWLKAVKKSGLLKRTSKIDVTVDAPYIQEVMNHVSF